MRRKNRTNNYIANIKTIEDKRAKEVGVQTVRLRTYE